MMKRLVFTAVLAMGAGICGGAALSGVLNAPLVHAQSPEENKLKAQKWEHCSVAPVNGVSEGVGKITGAAMIYYVRGSALQSERVEATIDGDLRAMDTAQNSAMAKAIGKLSDEGWQMVGEGSIFPHKDVDQRVLYFRRPKL